MLTYNLSQEKRNSEDKDPLFDIAVKLIQETGKASTTFLQRKLMVGYARSAKILDEIEMAGLVGPSNGAHPREILIPNANNQWQVPTPPPESKIIEEEVPIKWNKTKYADNKSDDFEINLGVDENNKDVRLNLSKYGNLMVIGSQFTSAVNLLNNILVNSMASYSPEELRIIAMDGIKGDLIVPNQASHLLTPLIVESEKSISALKWAVNEVQNRLKFLTEVDDKDIKNCNDKSGYQMMPNILIVISSLNQLLLFSPTEIEDNLYRLISTGKKCGIYLVIGADYLNTKISKEIMANSPTKLVFKPTDKKVARDTGVPESADLTSPDEAILETMFEGKKKITIKKLNPKKIYGEIFN
ncbi:MAG: DNA translocase FtsK [Candidatus Shapirobacteria bacterium]|nr:DNA translocase FtsK [Candidatus Shapirobacteria bacterium]